MATFDDGKEPGALRTIGEVTAATGVKSHVLRYWEAQFPVLTPLTRSGGRRYYRPEDVALVREIDRLVNREGYTLKGAKAALKGVASPSTALQRGSEASEDQTDQTDLLPGLRAIRDDLARALAA